MPDTILVTGGAGYIGSQTCKALARADFLPASYDNLGRGWAVGWGPLEVGELADAARLSAVIERYRPLAVLHFTAYDYVGESLENPALHLGTNVANSWQLLECLRKAGINKLVFSSSCATYGGIPESPIGEFTSQHPVSTYGRSKLVIEQMLAGYGRAYGLHSTSLRYFNAAGADLEGEIDEWHLPEPHIVPTVLRVAAGLEAQVRINGDDYLTPDGTCVRNFTHVADLADAHVAALQALLTGGPEGAFNLGNCAGFSLLQGCRRRARSRTMPSLAKCAHALQEIRPMSAMPRWRADIWAGSRATTSSRRSCRMLGAGCSAPWPGSLPMPVDMSRFSNAGFDRSAPRWNRISQKNQ